MKGLQSERLTRINLESINGQSARILEESIYGEKKILSLGRILVSGAWVQIKQAYICISETWREVTEISVLNDGSWKKLVN